MTPTRALVGLAVVAAAGYAVISSASSEGPKYLGDMPSIMAKASAAPPPVTHFQAGPSVPDPPHIAAHPVVPEAPAAAPPAVPGPGPIGTAAPVGGGGAGNGEPGAAPGLGDPASGLLSGGLLKGLPLLGSLPTSVDVSKICVVAGRVFAYVPCDQLPPGTIPPVVIPPVTVP
jgi:hypothetical protein